MMTRTRRYAKVAAQRMRELNNEIKKAGSVEDLVLQLTDVFMQDGKANIHVNLAEAELYTSLSWHQHRQMNAEIFDFIEESANLLPAQVPLRLVLHNAPFKERDQVRELIIQHYRLKLQDQMWDKRKNRNKMIMMITVGIIFLGAYLLLALNRDDTLFLEILSVIGSFSLWEAANCFLVERREIHRALMETAQFLTMEITFDEDTSPKEE